MSRVKPAPASAKFAFALALATFGALSPLACSDKEPTTSTYFERTISPIVTTSCVRTNTGAGCHVADAKGNALGNLDTATFAGVDKRRDLLLDYGPYGQPAFLLKNVEPTQVQITTYDGKRITVTTDIKHAGGSVLDPTGSAYRTLRRWIASGATENNAGVATEQVERQPCNGAIPARGFDLSKDPPRGDFALFRDKVNPLLTRPLESGKDVSCAAGNCHGTETNALTLTCGDTPEQVRFNYYAAEEYLTQVPEQSELLRRPLSPAQGGAYHEGGVLFDSPSSEGYRRLDEWARAHGPPVLPAAEPGFAFFSDRVQPMLVKKGCVMAQCHSPAMFHDYRLRGGSGGSFSLSATRKNYELSLAQMALDTEDLGASRLVRKNLYRPEVCSVAGCEEPAGIAHRGGPLLEDFGGSTASAALCDAAGHDYDAGNLDTIPAYCVLLEWLRRERAAHPAAPLSSVVYVRRPLGSVRRAQDYDVYSPGSDLRHVPVTRGAGGVLTPSGEDRSLTAGCGLDVATADIQRPQVSWDGARVAFAARSSASEPLAVYEMHADGTACQKHPLVNATPPSQNGLLIHNFDPTYVPENGEARIVWASTRGNGPEVATDYSGPQRTPADPTKGNANLFVLEADGRARQLTFLLNLERQPTFMNDGRLIFVAEKRAPEFAQLALRRLNLDSGDYHPLYAQRGSIGYPEATNVVELADKDFAAIFRDANTPHGGGALVVVNRSLGIDFRSDRPADYPIDPSVLDPASPSAPDPQFFLRSLRQPDPAANARVGLPTSGLYASPSALPDAQILVSFGEAPEPSAFTGDYDLYVMSAETGRRTKLLGQPGFAEVDAVAVYGRYARPIYRSALDEPNGHTRIVSGQTKAEVHVLDWRVLASLLFQNTPTGRLIDPELRQVEVYEDLPPPLDVDSFDKGGANVASDAFGRVYVRRRLLGSVVLEEDGSSKFEVPGGVPIVFKLNDTALSRERNLPRWQREQYVFSPGEIVNQSFKQDLFGGLCGTCHGSVSGKPIDAALKPDFVTQASATIARTKPPEPLAKPPAERGAPQGPPATP